MNVNMRLDFRVHIYIYICHYFTRLIVRVRWALCRNRWYFSFLINLEKQYNDGSFIGKMVGI